MEATMAKRTTKLGAAAHACKGKKGKAFRSCVSQKAGKRKRR